MDWFKLLKEQVTKSSHSSQQSWYNLKRDIYFQKNLYIQNTMPVVNGLHRDIEGLAWRGRYRWGLRCVHWQRTGMGWGGQDGEKAIWTKTVLTFGQLEFQFGKLFANILRQPSDVHVEFGHCNSRRRAGTRRPLTHRVSQTDKGGDRTLVPTISMINADR